MEGFALAGGLEIALTCDLIVAAKGVKLGIPEVNKGLFAAGGGLFRLPERVPYGVAMEMALTSDPILAEQAHELGLVARLAEPGKAAEVALALAERIAQNAPLAVAASKQIVRQTRGLIEEDAWTLQSPHAAKVFTSQDAKEGPRAFAEKRPPPLDRQVARKGTFLHRRLFTAEKLPMQERPLSYFSYAEVMG